MNIFDAYLSSTPRVTGHRWSINSSYYYSESKLSELDKQSWSDHHLWNNHQNWEMGQMAVLKLSTQETLWVEVIAVSTDSLWVVDRTLACSYLTNGETKESTLLKAQRKISLSDIINSFLIKN